MRIGMMLRVFDEKGGIGVYARNLVRELLSIDQKNEYYFFYNSYEHLGSFAQCSNVHEILIKGKSKFVWDQISIPFLCWRKKIDVVFHPKFTVPFIAPSKAIMVVHGADWFMPDQAIYYPWLDVFYIRTVMPYYFQKAAAVISVSQLTTDNFENVLDLPTGKLKTVYFGPAKNFKHITDKKELSRVKEKYGLPNKFIFTLTKRKGDKRKNLEQIFRAYAQYHKMQNNPHKLVIGGKDCYLYRDEYGIPENGFGKDILFPGWIDQTDLPMVYSSADVFLYPSNLEAFPIPITEAMTCGTPIITSDANGLREIAGDGALFVDPQDTNEICKAIHDVLIDDKLRNSLSIKGIERSKLYSWEICARKTLEIIEEVA